MSRFSLIVDGVEAYETRSSAAGGMLTGEEVGGALIAGMYLQVRTEGT